MLISNLKWEMTWYDIRIRIVNVTAVKNLNREINVNLVKTRFYKFAKLFLFAVINTIFTIWWQYFVGVNILQNYKKNHPPNIINGFLNVPSFKLC
jgi:hypothetical protein